MDSAAESIDALVVASCIAPLCDSGESRLVIEALESADEETIRRCLNDSYFASSCPQRLRDDFIVRLADHSRRKVLSVVIQLLVSRESLPRLAGMFHKLAERGDHNLLHDVLIVGSQATSDDTEVHMRIVSQACELVVNTAFENLKPAVSPIDKDKFNNFAWNHYYSQIAVLEKSSPSFLGTQ